MLLPWATDIFAVEGVVFAGKVSGREMSGAANGATSVGVTIGSATTCAAAAAAAAAVFVSLSTSTDATSKVTRVVIATASR